MALVLIIRGYCGTGKSTIAKYISKRYQFAFLEYDNFLWDLNSYVKPAKSEYEITFKNFMSVLKNYLKTDKSILIEGPLVSRCGDDPFDLKKVISAITKSNHQLKIVQLTATEDVCLQRMKNRNHIVPKWERDMFRKGHDDSIQKDEVIIDTTKLTLNQTINRIKKLL